MGDYHTPVAPYNNHPIQHLERTAYVISKVALASSNVTVYQLEGLTILAKYFQRLGFGHVHHVCNLLRGSPLYILNQSRQVYCE